MPVVRLSVDLDGICAALEPLLVGLLPPTSSDGKLSLTSSSDDALECLLKLSLLSSMLSVWRNDTLFMMLAEGCRWMPTTQRISLLILRLVSTSGVMNERDHLTSHSSRV